MADATASRLIISIDIGTSTSAVVVYYGTPGAFLAKQIVTRSILAPLLYRTQGVPKLLNRLLLAMWTVGLDKPTGFMIRRFHLCSCTTAEGR